MVSWVNHLVSGTPQFLGSSGVQLCCWGSNRIPEKLLFLDCGGSVDQYEWYPEWITWYLFCHTSVFRVLRCTVVLPVSLGVVTFLDPDPGVSSQPQWAEVEAVEFHDLGPYILLVQYLITLIYTDTICLIRPMFSNQLTKMPICPNLSSKRRKVVEPSRKVWILPCS